MSAAVVCQTRTPATIAATIAAPPSQPAAIVLALLCLVATIREVRVARRVPRARQHNATKSSRWTLVAWGVLHRIEHGLFSDRPDAPLDRPRDVVDRTEPAQPVTFRAIFGEPQAIDKFRSLHQKVVAHSPI